MDWHKVEDYPNKYKDYVLVAQENLGIWHSARHFTARLNENGYWEDQIGIISKAYPTDKWSYIKLPEN